MKREGFEIMCKSCPFKKGNDAELHAEMVGTCPTYVAANSPISMVRQIARDQADNHGGFRCHSLDQLPIPEHPICAGARAYLQKKRGR